MTEQPPGRKEKAAPVIRDLASKIACGTYGPGRKIPSLRKLSERYGVSVSTARRSVKALADKGMLTFLHGSGTFVAEKRSPADRRFRIAAVAATVGRMAMDLCLFLCPNFGFVSLPESLTTGSSIMPHKKNPDVFELIRGRCNRLQALPNEMALLLTNLPVGYHRDMQLLKDILFPAFEELHRTLRMADFMLANLRVNERILDDPKYDYLFTVEDVNRLVLAGVPFREAYREVGMQVQRGEYRPDRTLHHTHEGSIGNLCTAEIRAKMERVMKEPEEA